MKKGLKALDIGNKPDNELPEKRFVLVIPNIRSAHNVGSLFRSADGAGVSHVYLAGHTPTILDRFGRLGKPQKEIAKTALGAELAIPSEYVASLKTIVMRLKKDGFTVIGLEQDDRSIKLESSNDELNDLLKDRKQIALVVGEEVRGMTGSDIALMDYLIELPMRGEKESLNVSVAGGIAMYEIARALNI